MAHKVFHLLCFIFLLLQALSTSVISHAKREMPSDKISSPFEFLNQLKGVQKGHKTKEIHQLKKYLQKFGYLDQKQTLDGDFDETLESAVKTYQQNYKIKPTGILDDETRSKMAAPRCGVPDIVNGINLMQPIERMRSNYSINSTHILVSHYSLNPYNRKWPSSKRSLTYRFLPSTPSNARGAVARAFQAWTNSTQSYFTFSESKNAVSDLVISFERRNHGDGNPFDGPGGVHAHAFYPTDGRLHYDADDQWAVGSVPGKFDLETIGTHEIGHLLGLDHSMIRNAIMYAYTNPGETRNLTSDDVQGIKALGKIAFLVP